MPCRLARVLETYITIICIITNVIFVKLTFKYGYIIINLKIMVNLVCILQYLNVVKKWLIMKMNDLGRSLLGNLYVIVIGG